MVRVDAITLPHEAVQLLDAMLAVAAVAAHVPLPGRAALARDGVGLADDADREVARFEPAAPGCLDDPAQGLVAEHRPLVARRRPAVLAVGNLEVGAADSYRQRLNQHRPLPGRRLGNVVQAGRSRLSW
jgi:hypothetical protein